MIKTERILDILTCLIIFISAGIIIYLGFNSDWKTSFAMFFLMVFLNGVVTLVRVVYYDINRYFDLIEIGVDMTTESSSLSEESLLRWKKDAYNNLYGITKFVLKVFYKYVEPK